MFKLFVALAAAISAVVTSVNAHGYVQEVTANGVKYSGYLPYSDPYYNPVPQRIIRKIPGNGRLHGDAAHNDDADINAQALSRM